MELVFFRGWRCRRGGLAQIARLRARVRPDEPLPDISKYVRQDFVINWVSIPQICRAGRRGEGPPRRRSRGKMPRYERESWAPTEATGGAGV